MSLVPLASPATSSIVTAQNNTSRVPEVKSKVKNSAMS